MGKQVWTGYSCQNRFTWNCGFKQPFRYSLGYLSTWLSRNKLTIIFLLVLSCETSVWLWSSKLTDYFCWIVGMMQLNVSTEKHDEILDKKV